MKALTSVLVLSLVLTNCERPSDNQAELRALRREIEDLKAQQELKAQPVALPQHPLPNVAIPTPQLEAGVTSSPLPPKQNKDAKTVRRAPNGIFYLTQRVTIPIEGGVKGLPPGTEVTRISQDANGVTIQSADGLKGVVPAYNLTNDLDEAEEITAGYAKEQQESALARARLAEQLAVNERERRKKEEAENKRKKQESVPYTPPYVRSSPMQRIGGGG